MPVSGASGYHSPASFHKDDGWRRAVPEPVLRDVADMPNIVPPASPMAYL